MEENIKYCPHCGKPIKAAALKCIHCKQWVDGRDASTEQPESTNKANSSSGISPVVAIIAALAVIVLGVLIYYLAKGDGETSEPDRTEKYYDNAGSRYRDKSSSYYDDDDDYSSSSSSFVPSFMPFTVPLTVQ